MAMPSPARHGLKHHAPSGRFSAALPVAPSKPIATRRRQKTVAITTPSALVHELGSCIHEVDIIQVLYRGLEPLFGYNVVLLQVLEREGWYHSIPIDSGVLQDLRRRPLAGTTFAQQYANPRTSVVKNVGPERLETSKGPGGARTPRFAIWVPVEHQGEVIGSVVYQSHRNRRVPATEIAFLNEVHRRLGVLIANASLNELTRKQARRLEALNSIARALGWTLV